MRSHQLAPLALSTAAALALCASSIAQTTALRPRWRPTKDLATSLSPAGQPLELVLKLVDDAGAIAVGGRLISGSRVDVSIVGDWIEAQPLATVEPLIGDIPFARLDELRRRGEERAGIELADLSQFFLVRLPEGADPRELMANLLAQPEVENAYLAPRAGPPPSAAVASAPPPYPQLYRSAAPLGVDADFANFTSGEPGGSGAGVTLLDIEGAWNIPINANNWAAAGHDDLSQLGPTAPLSSAWPISDTSTWFDPFLPAATAFNHGTAVLGLLGADRDASGVDGLANDAAIRVLPSWLWSASAGVARYQIVNAVVVAALELEPGDVVLIEEHVWGPNSVAHSQQLPQSWCLTTINSQWGMVPQEYYDAEFHAIRQATALGLHVVEIAGNGYQELDDYAMVGVCAEGHPSYTRFDPAVRDSGAILVGAGSPSTGTSGLHQALNFSNNGKRLDAHCWGGSVTTCGFGDIPNGPGVDDDYTQIFGGTSSASAITAGVVAIVEGVYEDLYGVPMAPEQLRLLLRENGLPAEGVILYGTGQVGPKLDVIGRQPDLRDILGNLRSGAVLPGSIGGAWSRSFSGGWMVLAMPGSVLTTVGLGGPVGSLGDRDGDGEAELFFHAAPTRTVYVKSGRTGRSAGQWGTQLYSALATVGDADGDGTTDAFCVGQSGVSGATCSAYFVDPLDGQALAYTPLPENIQLETFPGGDVNADGKADGFLLAQGPTPGVWVVVSDGHGQSMVHHEMLADATSLLPSAVCSLGDVDGDACADYAVGWDQWGGNGRVYLWSALSRSIVNVWSGGLHSGLGRSLAGGADVDGDGINDLLIGTGMSYGSFGPQPGGYYLYSGDENHPLGPFPLIRSLLAQSSRFGEELAFIGDWNGDGTSDYAISEPSSTVVGAVRIYSGRSGAEIAKLVGQSGGFGSTLTPLGDIDGDGRVELAVGDPGFASPGNSGRTYVYSAPVPSPPAPGAPTLVADPPYIEAQLPTSLGLASAKLRIQSPQHAGQPYLIYASKGGSTPGTELPDGRIAPINAFANCTQAALPVSLPWFPAGCLPQRYFAKAFRGAFSGAAPFTAFMGTLGSDGSASATFGPFYAANDPTAPLGAPQLRWPSTDVYTFVAVTLDASGNIDLLSNAAEIAVISEY